MPARRPITQERLKEVGATAVHAALQDVLRQTGARWDAGLKCTYSGPAESDTEVTCKTIVMFQWELSWDGENIYAEMPIRSDKAIYSGMLVPPRSWIYMLIALSLPRAINEAGGLPWMRDGESVVECTGLAMAKPPVNEPEFCILFDGGARVQHLVLARTDSHLFCSTSPLPSPGGIVKATREQEWSEGAFPHKRLRGRIQGHGLAELVAEHQQAYATTLAVAHLMVAEDRGGIDGEVKERLLMNPLQWDLTLSTHLLLLWRVKAGTSHGRWRSHVRVVSLSSVLKELQAL